MRFEKSTTKSVEKSDTKEEAEEEQIEEEVNEIFEGEGLKILSDESADAVYRESDGELKLKPNIHSWYAHFTPFDKLEAAPEVKSPALIMLYDDLKKLFDKVDSGQLEQPDMIQGDTNRRMAEVAQSLGFEVVNTSIPADELDDLGESQVKEMLNSQKIGDFFNQILEVVRSIREDTEAAKKFVEAYNNLSGEDKKSIDKLFTLIHRQGEQGRTVRRWIENRIKNFEAEVQEQTREAIKRAAEMMGDTDNRRLIAQPEDIRTALQELESRELSSGEKFIDSLRERAEENTPDPVDKKWDIV